MEGKSLREQLAEARLSWQGPQAPADEAVREKYPLLFELLTCQLEEAGRLLDPARLTISAGDGEWILSVSDGALAQSFSIRTATLLDALEKLDLALSDSAGKWVPYRNRKPKLKGLKPSKGERSQNGVARPKKRK